MTANSCPGSAILSGLMRMHRFTWALFFLAACSAKPLATTNSNPAHEVPTEAPASLPATDPLPTPPSPASAPSAPSAPPNDAAISSNAAVPAPSGDTPPPEVNSPFLPPSDLKRSVSEWIRANPKSDFEDAARAANRYLRESGYPLVLDVAGLIPKEATTFRMKAGIRTFEFQAGKELSTDLDVCGERFLRIPGRYLGGDEAVLVTKEAEYPFSLKGFRRERFRVMKKKREINTVYAPEPTEPIGLAANGSAVYLKFPLDDALTAAWWQRMGNFQPSLLDEDPYLVIRVAKNSLYFDENLEHLPAQEFEVEQSDKGSFRWRFEPSGLVLELDSRCGAERTSQRS